MSGGSSHPVDLDLLADYSAGVLDAAEAAQVADLIATDNRWARSYEALVRAEAAVRADLQAAAAATERMPDDVAARLDNTLAGPAGRGETARGGVVVSLDTARARRRRIVTAVAGAAAAGVAVVGGLTVALNNPMMAGSAGDAPAVARQESGGSPPMERAPSGGDVSGWPLMLASGRDYTPASIGEIGTYASAAPPPKITKDDQQPDVALGEAPRAAAGGELARLASPVALDACLAAISTLHPGVPAVVDFARYEGVPALITLVRQGETSIIVVVGQECGENGADLITTAPA